MNKTTQQEREEARVRMGEYRKTIEYKKWLDASRELRRSYKEKYRRADGAVPREEIKRRAALRAAEKESSRVAREIFVASFIGPLAPCRAMTDAEYYAWRTCNDPDFYARELDRAQRYKARTRPGYKDSVVKWAEMPAAVKSVKHLQYLISRQINRSEHENH